ncbi:unnamed protein product, partial [Vitis vinifera]|uniref:Serine-threonine/tyrosine-protein kinase catalytic domain-containing protein n=1 Tax=Vitis vinifera TaxID=29760 RepID=D7U4Z7_VITVI
MPKSTHPNLAELLERCWQQDPTLRPDFSEIIEILQQIAKEVGDEEDRPKVQSSSGFLSVLRRAITDHKENHDYSRDVKT